MRTFNSMKEFKAYADEISKTYKYGFTISEYNEDFSIDVDGHVRLHEQNLTELPIKFNIVTRNFVCHYNQLTSLKGCPKYVGENFCCNNNQLTSLKGCPVHVSYFECSNNQLTSLKGCPKIIRGNWRIEDKYKSYPEYQKYLLVKKIEAL